MFIYYYSILLFLSKKNNKIVLPRIHINIKILIIVSIFIYSPDMFQIKSTSFSDRNLYLIINIFTNLKNL